MAPFYRWHNCEEKQCLHLLAFHSGGTSQSSGFCKCSSSVKYYTSPSKNSSLFTNPMTQHSFAVTGFSVRTSLCPSGNHWFRKRIVHAQNFSISAELAFLPLLLLSIPMFVCRLHALSLSNPFLPLSPPVVLPQLKCLLVLDKCTFLQNEQCYLNLKQQQSF